MTEMSNKIGPETLHRWKELDYIEIDVRRALKNVGYVLVKMPDFDMTHLSLTRDGFIVRTKFMLGKLGIGSQLYYSKMERVGMVKIS